MCDVCMVVETRQLVEGAERNIFDTHSGNSHPALVVKEQSSAL